PWKALLAASQSLRVSTELGDRPAQARALRRQATAYAADGGTSAAQRCLAAALAIQDSDGDPGERGRCRLPLAGGLRALPDQADIGAQRLEEAAEQLRLSCDLAERAGDRPLQAEALRLLGFVNRRQGRVEEASQSFDRAVRLHREIEDRREYALALVGL